jgi:hypothetical protein
MARKKKGKDSLVAVRGFLRGQLVEHETGKVMGDTGWIQNKMTNAGLTNLGLLLAGAAGSSKVSYACMGTQTAAVDMTQTSVLGTINSFRALDLTTSGTMTVTCTAAFSSASLTASAVVGAAGLYNTNSGGTMYACQTFTPSTWASNQDFNLTYQIRFATA